MAESTKTLVPSQRLRVAYLLTLVGGYLDAYTYFERGGVFANAQTGNIVKFAIALANGAKDTYLSFLLPITAFVLGLFASLTLSEALLLRNRRLVRRAVLASEMCGLALVALVPVSEQWNMLANCIVSFVAAMQFETFSTFRGDAIATTMSTGNLRKFVDSLYLGTIRHDTRQLMRALRFLSIIATFVAGAFVGTLLCNHMGPEAVIPAIIVLGLTIVVITVLHHRNASLK